MNRENSRTSHRSYLKHNEPVERISLYLPQSRGQSIKRSASRLGLSLNLLINNLIDQRLDGEPHEK